MVQGDYVRMYVEGKGAETSKSTMNADLTVPKFGVNIISKENSHTMGTAGDLGKDFVT
ncbi:hypothetical protein [Mycobacterium haemophilum]|uniref:hypothetical protein n=1 Tax=Mycobacterium haemophilum TaxID=29311 RepID=UPI000AA1DE91|nr:hypothetical protein [Mycobacterium haemophilum]MCV7340102.1 hypothetical protein [Mycobacterium haemophilum DSM 44634]